MYSPFKTLFSGLTGLVFACVLLWQAVDATGRNRRLAVNPHEFARVERTWTTSGRHSARYADLSFQSPGAPGASWCHAQQVRLGSSSVPARVGQSIDVVPIPGSCDAPDVPTNAASGLMVAIEYTFSLLVFVVGTFKIAGLPVPFARRAF